MIDRIFVDYTTPILVSRLNVGVTLTQRVTDDAFPGTEEARARADEHLAAMKSAWFVQHLGTWGINLNEVWPTPETFNWAPFYRRMNWIAQRGLENVVIGCYGPPNWMLIPGPSKTYGQLNPIYEQMWADFCAIAICKVLDLGTNVPIACCWNENKGDGNFGGDWDMATNTRRYNTWYSTLRSYPRLDQVELVGPYFPVEINTPGSSTISTRDRDSIDTWYQGAVDANKIAVDHALSHGKPVIPKGTAINRAGSFGEIARELRMTYPAHLVMVMEGYINSTLTEYDSYDIQFQAAWSFARLRGELMSGWVSHSFSWGLTGDGRYAPGGCIASWLVDTRPLSGKGAETATGLPPGGKTPMYDVYRMFHEHAGPRKAIYYGRSTNPNVSVLATETATLIANLSEDPVVVRFENDTIALDRYEVRAIEINL